MKNIVTTLALMLLTVFAGISATAQEAQEAQEQRHESSEDRIQNARRLEGVWNIQVTRINCQTGAVIAIFPAMHMYMRGGTMEDFGTQNSPTLRGPGYGTWTHESRRRYSLTFQFFRFNPDGTLAGRNVARQVNELSNDGNSLTQTSIAQALDTNGNVIGTNCAVATGSRFE